MSLLRTVSFRRGVPAGQRNDLCPAGATRRDPRRSTSASSPASRS